MKKKLSMSEYEISILQKFENIFQENIRPVAELAKIPLDMIDLIHTLNQTAIKKAVHLTLQSVKRGEIELDQ